MATAIDGLREASQAVLHSWRSVDVHNTTLSSRDRGEQAFAEQSVDVREARSVTNLYLIVACMRATPMSELVAGLGPYSFEDPQGGHTKRERTWCNLSR